MYLLLLLSSYSIPVASSTLVVVDLCCTAIVSHSVTVTETGESEAITLTIGIESTSWTPREIQRLTEESIHRKVQPESRLKVTGECQ